MNIEQLEKGKKLRSQIDELNRTQTNLINKYKKGKTRQTVYVSFDGNHGEYYTIGEDAINQVFNLINGDLMKKITALETEFEHL